VMEAINVRPKEASLTSMFIRHCGMLRWLTSLPVVFSCEQLFPKTARSLITSEA
jgi:hypothetical protein